MTFFYNTNEIFLHSEKLNKTSMETVYLGIVIFLFMLAVFDLLVGVSNDAVNFMNSAVGQKSQSLKQLLLWRLSVSSLVPY